MNRFAKFFIFSFFAVLLLAPAVQILGIIHITPLEGAYTISKRPVFSGSAWLSGEFQEQSNKYIEDKIGFRSWMVRLRNEIDYKLFGIVHANNLVIGKDEVLYQTTYLTAINGDDFVGEDIVQRKLDKLQCVQDELAKKDVFLLLLLAPGKASIYPEYIPDEWNAKPKSRTNYDAYIQGLSHRNINYIDLRSYLSEVKDTARHPIFPKCGTHWSGYTITLVADTLLKFLENKMNIELNSFHSSEGYSTDTEFRFTDNDIGSALNLIRDIKSWQVYYPTITFDNDSTKTKPDILAIGDSFTQSFWGFYPFFDTMFGSNSQYWYYNQIVSWPDSLEYFYTPTSFLDYKKEIESRKIVLLVTTEQNLNNFGFSFIDEAYSIYNPSNDYAQNIQDFINKAHSDTSVRAMIQKKADENYQSFDKAAFIDAKWMINEKSKQEDAELHQQYLDSVQSENSKPSKNR